jgi:hypothetical protein
MIDLIDRSFDYYYYYFGEMKIRGEAGGEGDLPSTPSLN